LVPWPLRDLLPGAGGPPPQRLRLPLPPPRRTAAAFPPPRRLPRRRPGGSGVKTQPEGPVRALADATDQHRRGWVRPRPALDQPAQYRPGPGHATPYLRGLPESWGDAERWFPARRAGAGLPPRDLRGTLAHHWQSLELRQPLPAQPLLQPRRCAPARPLGPDD